jgi:hypothetical protein
MGLINVADVKRCNNRRGWRCRTCRLTESSITTLDMTKTTAADVFAADLKATADAIDAIADVAFAGESFDVRIDRAIVQAKIAKRAADDAAQYLAQIRSEILALMVDSDLATFESESGKVTVCKGKRTVSVTDPALKAEISLIKERGVRTGRCTEKTGDPYVIIK